MTIDDMMKQTFDSLEVDTRIYAEFEHDGGLYSGNFKVIWIDKGESCISLTTPNESPYGTCIGVPLKNFFSLVNISNNKEEITMTDYGRKLEKEYRDGMVVGAIYDFMGRNTYGLMRGYTFAGFDGCGEDLKLNFINERTNTPYQIYASDIGRCSLIAKPIEEKSDTLPEPIHLLEKIGEGRLVFDERAFYKYTGNTRHFNIVINDDVYECLFKKVNDVFSYCAEIACGLWRGDKVYKGRLWNDQFRIEDISSNDIQSFTPEQFRIQTLSGDLIPFRDLFEKENVYKWNIELEVGEAYSLRLPNYENLVDGIFMGYYENIDAIKFVIFDTDKSDTSIIAITKAAIEDGDYEVRQLSLSYHRRDRHE